MMSTISINTTLKWIWQRHTPIGIDIQRSPTNIRTTLTFITSTRIEAEATVSR